MKRFGLILVVVLVGVVFSACAPWQAAEGTEMNLRFEVQVALVNGNWKNLGEFYFPTRVEKNQLCLNEKGIKQGLVLIPSYPQNLFQVEIEGQRCWSGQELEDDRIVRVRVNCWQDREKDKIECAAFGGTVDLFPSRFEYVCAVAGEDNLKECQEEATKALILFLNFPGLK